MTVIKQMVLNLCYASLVAGIFRLIAPAGSFEKTARLVITVFMLLSLLTPFTGQYDLKNVFTFDFQQFIPETDWLEGKDNVFEQAAIAEVKSTVQAAATQNGVSAEVIAAETAYSEGKVYITAITIVVDGNEAQAKNVKRTVEQWINGTISVQWTQEGTE